MTHEQFNLLLARRIKQTENVLATKAEEYATLDRLHNFKRAAEYLQTNPETACLAFMTKHLISVRDMVRDGKKLTHEYIDEKIGGAINYLILLEAILKEEK